MNLEKKINIKKYPPCKICKRINHLEKDCWFRRTQCHFCKKYGHVEKVCRLKNNQNANYSETKNENINEGQLFYACQSVAESNKDTWLIDSGCSSHMTPNKDIFTKIDKKFQSKVKLANNRFVEVMGK